MICQINKLNRVNLQLNKMINQLYMRDDFMN